MRVIVDFDVCQSTGTCQQICPEVFEVRDDGYLYVLQEEPAEALWAKVREHDARVSVATVYRTMKLLHECGLAHARNFGDGQTRYEAAVGRHHHDHLICTRCGTIVEFENDRIEVLQEKVARQHGFQVTSHKMELYGFCEACQRAISGGDSPRA